MCYPISGFSLSFPKRYGGKNFVDLDFVDLVNRLISYFAVACQWADDNRGSGR